MNSGRLTHDQLWLACKRLSTDWTPYGAANRDEMDDYTDCSCGCMWYHALRGADWGVCGNPSSPRCGLLTFEHQGGFGCMEPED